MMARIAVDGDNCGGPIMASARSTIDGDSIARIGDRVMPHGAANSIHRANPRIVSGSFRLRVGGERIARDGDYATCGHTISASNTTDDGSRHWAPRPPAAAVQSATPRSLSMTEAEVDIEWTQGERYPGHSGSVVQWKGPGQGYDASRQYDSGFVPGFGGNLVHTITGLAPDTTYDVRVLTTRRYADDGIAVETTVTTPPPP